MNKTVTGSNYSLNIIKILLPPARNLLIAVALLLIMRLPPVQDILFKTFLGILAFPLIIFIATFINVWFAKIADVVFFWIKRIDFETKTINRNLKYEDFYLIEYKYLFTERRKNTVYVLLILTADKKTKFKTLCEVERYADAPEECRKFIGLCKEQKKFIYLDGKEKPVRKFTVGKRTYTNWSFYRRIIANYFVWFVLAGLFYILCFYIVLFGIYNPMH